MSQQKEKRLEYMKQYRKNWNEKHFEYIKQYYKQWYQKNREKTYQYNKWWKKKNHDRWLETMRKVRNRRKREYPTNIILNDYFKGGHLHHLTPWVAMYIPDEMHNSIRHNLRTGKNMYEINRKALDFWLGRGV